MATREKQEQRLTVGLKQVSGRRWKIVHDVAAKPFLARAAGLQAGACDLPACDEATEIVNRVTGAFDAYAVLLRGYCQQGLDDKIAAVEGAAMADDVPLFWEFPDDGLLEWKVTANQPLHRFLLQSAVISAARGHLKTATRNFRRLLALDPADEPGAGGLLLACLFGLEEWPEAVTLCEERLAVAPSPEFRYGLALALARSGSGAAAAAEFRLAVKLAPGIARALAEPGISPEKDEARRYTTLFGGYWRESDEARTLLGVPAAKKKRGS